MTDSHIYIAGTSILGGNANLSLDGTYRYWLTRYWGQITDPSQRVTFVMLNPSTADAQVDDATIRRCIGFAKAWGYDGLAVVNLFALRATNPKALLDHEDPVGPQNAEMMRFWLTRADVVVAAWGASYPRAFVPYVEDMAQVLRQDYDAKVLSLTNSGDPRHPLYLPGDTRPQRWPVI